MKNFSGFNFFNFNFKGGKQKYRKQGDLIRKGTTRKEWDNEKTGIRTVRGNVVKGGIDSVLISHDLTHIRIGLTL